jgi:hypothetical protein
MRAGHVTVFTLIVACGAEPVNPATPPAPVVTEAPAKPDEPPPEDEGCFDEPVRYAGIEAVAIGLDPDAALAACESPPAGSVAECRYAVAQACFEANHFEKAGPMFLDLALDPAAADLGPPSARRAIESMNVLTSLAQPPRVVCFEEMRAIVPRLLAAVCGADALEAHDDCDAVRSAGIAARVRHANDLVDRADRGAKELYGRAGDAFYSLAEEHCIGGKKPLRPLHCDEALFIAHRAYRAAGDTAKATAARRALLDPENGWHETGLARKLAQEPE